MVPWPFKNSVEKVKIAPPPQKKERNLMTPNQ